MLVRSIPAWVADTNAYVIADEPGGLAFVVDVPPEPDKIGSYVAGLDLSLVGVLLTHGHIDHTGGAGALSSQTQAATYVHPDDDYLTLHPQDQLKRMFGMIPPGSYEVPESRIDLDHGQTLSLAGFDLEVIHTPGHTPGHCCFLIREEGTLFSGDQLFAGSVGRTDLEGGSWEDLVVSMRDRVMTLEDDVRVLPGHGPETSIGRERQTNPFRAEWTVTHN